MDGYIHLFWIYPDIHGYIITNEKFPVNHKT